MAKKTTVSKIYKSKIDLPGGCKKGTMVQDGKYVDTGKPCPYNCAKEKQFFEVIIPTVYKVGSTVIIQKTDKFRNCDIKGDTYGHYTFVLPAYTPLKVVGEKRNASGLNVIVMFNPNYYYLIPEKNLCNTGVYYYVSSTGIIHPAYVGRDEKADKYRKSVKNYHTTKEEAEKYKSKLINLK